ncbi:MAG: hypothetical protein FJ399_01190 [Verrucomicrobia bacterium]|nr:hypothetical protein [Verrucomicrobiota bacterium]
MIRVADILPKNWLDVFSPHHGQIGIGLDPATTTKATSNPSAIVVDQRVNLTHFFRLALRFKTADPDVTFYLLNTIVTGLRGRGLSVRRLCILATNERFFAVSVRKKMTGKVPVELVIESEKTTYLGEGMLMKAYLGALLVNTIDDGYLALPGAEFVKTDLRLVVRDRGTFDSEIGEDGGHGDIFAAGGAAIHAITAKGGVPEAHAVQVGTFGARPAVGRKLHPESQPYGRPQARRIC